VHKAIEPVLKMLTETFKIVNRKYDINPELFFQLGEGDGRDMAINCSRKDLD